MRGLTPHIVDFRKLTELPTIRKKLLLMVPEPKKKDLPTNRTKAEVFGVLREKNNFKYIDLFILQNL